MATLHVLHDNGSISCIKDAKFRQNIFIRAIREDFSHQNPTLIKFSRYNIGKNCLIFKNYALMVSAKLRFINFQGSSFKVFMPKNLDD